MVTISHLSEDSIYTILSLDIISIQDVVNFCSTSKRYYHILENNFIWRKKFYQKWPQLKALCEKEMRKGHINFKELIKACLKCKKELQCFMTQTSKDNYYSHFVFDKSGSYNRTCPHKTISIIDEDLNFLISPYERTHSWNYYFVMDELKDLIEQSQSGCKTNLTNIYYAEKLFPFMKHNYIRIAWQEFLSRPDKRQLLEEAATFVAQWFQPEKKISHSYIRKQLDDITQVMMEHLKIKHPKHPIFSMSHEQLSYWRYNNIKQNVWNDKDGRQVLDVFCKTLPKLNFRIIDSFRNSAFIRNFAFIDYALKKRITCGLLLAVICQSVARRLGLRCNLIFFPSHCFLSWKPKYDIKGNDNDEDWYYIDLLRGVLLNKDDCPAIHGHTKCPVQNFRSEGINCAQLIIKLLHRINVTIDPQSDIETRWLLELRHMADPSDLDLTLHLGQYYIKRGISVSTLTTTAEKADYSKWDKYDMKRVTSILNKLQRNEELMFKRKSYERETRLIPKKRDADMKFAVGMIVRSRATRNSRSMIGVITGWNELRPNFDVTLEPFDDDQCPCDRYYTILCEDERSYYFSEDYLDKIDKPKPLNSKEIGKYFCEFKDTYYMPNEVLAIHYPFDVLCLSNGL